MKRILQSKANKVGVILAFIALVLALGITNPSGAFALAEAEADGLSATQCVQSAQELDATPSATQSAAQESSSAFDAQSTEKRPNGGSEAVEASSGEAAESPSTSMDAPPSPSSDTPTLPEKGELATTSEVAPDQKQAALTGFVFISGNTKVGSSLVVGVEGAPNGAVLSYQWYRDAEPISGATSTVYTTTSADDGCDISCQVTAAGYSGVLVSGVIRPTSPAPQAFAVYSDDDKSLTFYKRPYLPSEGSMFAGKTATAVYAGIEKSAYEEETIPWKDYASAVLSVLVADEGIAPISTAHWFLSFVECVSMDIAKLDTSNVVDMTDMFYACIKLPNLDVSTFNTSKVTNMSLMFGCCDLLTELNFSGWDTSNVVDMAAMFAYDLSLKSLDLSMFDTAKVTDMAEMFGSCEALTDINMSGWDVSNVVSMLAMFAGCSSLTTLDLSSFNPLRVELSDSMFAECSNLTTIYVSPGVSWLPIINEPYTFNYCSRLVGGLGTSWSNEHRDGGYAHIDGLDGKPGYFTPKITVSYYDPESDSISTPVLYVYGITAAESSLEGFLGWALYPNATKPTIAVGERILYDPANIKDLVLYPVRLPALMGVVTISDASSPAKVGDTLIALVNGVQADALLHCQWYRGDVAIEGATGASYVLVHADAGQLITCKVTAENYRGTLISNMLGPIDQIVTVEYWAYTDASPNEYAIFYTKTALLSDAFDSTLDPNKDDDSSKHWTGYRTQCWWDENWIESYSISAPQEEAVTLAELARRAEWDGVSPIRVYAEAWLRYIEVTYDTGGYADQHHFQTVQFIAWIDCPYQDIAWLPYRMISQSDEYGNEIDKTMTCGYILTELLNDPDADTLLIFITWEKCTYNVSFWYPNGVTETVPGLEWTSTISLPTEGTGFDYPGHEFVGWFTEPGGAGNQVAGGTKCWQIVVNYLDPELTLYAHFKQLDLTGRAEISGGSNVGDTLTASVSAVPSDAQLCYQWYRDDGAIEGATAPSYTLVRPDGMHNIWCKVSDAHYGGALVSNNVGPVVHMVTVEYWSYTDASPNEYVVIYTETADLTSVFNHKLNQHEDDDPTNDYTGYNFTGWYDEWFNEFYDSSIPEEEFTTTLEQIADSVEWDGVSPIVMYSAPNLRYIKVIYDAGGYEELFSFSTVRYFPWFLTPYNSIPGWYGHRLVGVYDSLGHELNEEMSCGYILTELLGDPSGDTINVRFVWESDYYQVHFAFPNGVTQTVQGLEWTSPISLPTEGAGFDYPGYEFVGWFTEPEGAGTQISDGTFYSMIARDDIIEEITLYACFVPVAAEFAIAA